MVPVMAIIVSWALGGVRGGSQEEESHARVVRIFPEPRKTTVKGRPLVVMQDASGQGWLCRVGTVGIDEVSDVRQQSAYDDKNGTLPRIESIELYAQQRDASTCAQSPQRSGLYWSYELCSGVSARQFRPTGTATIGTPTHVKHDGESHSLGRFVETEGSVPETAPIERLVSLFPGVVGSVDGDGIVYALKRMRGAIVERYIEGEDGRSATAYAACLLAEREAPRRSSGPPAESRIYDEMRIARVTESPLLSYHLLVAAPRQLCSRGELAALATSREMRWLAGACLQHKAEEEWWTYEVCVGNRIRQFRATKQSDESQQASGIVLGKFDDEIGNVDQDESGDYDTFSLANPPMRFQRYSKGDRCDITGLERSANVYFRCSRPNRPIASAEPFIDTLEPFIASVVEKATCEYDITVALPAVCAILVSKYSLCAHKHLITTSVYSFAQEAGDFGASDSATVTHIDCEPAR